ncbi:MAG: PQQ-dependent sugar dehydrogenase [Chloroflexota bacterium]
MHAANRFRLISRFALGLALATAGAVASPSVSLGAVPLTLVQSGFSSPIYLTNAGDSRLFVVQQRGLIRIIHPNLSVTTFINLSGLVSQGGSERGLLGLAFHPDYASNGLFYVDYTRASDGDIVIAEYKRSAGDANVADPNSGRILLTIEHSSADNHNGGWVGFKGSSLYISVGDGGNTPNNAQNVGNLLGKILRINPLDPDGNGAATYSIPNSNPFVGRSGRDEIFAYGLRNPWRCSHDPGKGKLWCGDVGQNVYEEINRSKYGNGANYGWNKLEGRHNYPSGTLCSSSCKTLPIAEYSHSAAGGGNCAVTGGYVSRRSGAALYGKYVFGDYCSGKIWVIPANFAPGSALPAPADDTAHLISSFGRDNIGRLYLVALGGSIYRLTDS